METRLKKDNTIIFKDGCYKFVWKKIEWGYRPDYREIDEADKPHPVYWFHIYKREKDKWKKLAGNYAYDGATLGELAEIISIVLDEKNLEGFQKDRHDDPLTNEKTTYYSRHLETDRIFGEDYYCLDQYGIKKEEDENPLPGCDGSADWSGEIISITLGLQTFPQQVFCHECVTIQAERKELKRLMEAIDEAIDNARDRANTEFRQDLEANRKNKHISGRLLWQEETAWYKNSQNLYTVGQKGLLYTIADGGPLYIKEEEAEITEIIEGAKEEALVPDRAYLPPARETKKIKGSGSVRFLITENGKKKEILLPTEDIVDFWARPLEERLCMGKGSIAEDFMENVMDSNIWEDFSKMNKKSLYGKYMERLINMYWMCRSEHPYIRQNTKISQHVQGRKAAKKIIRKIRKEAKKGIPF